MTRAEMELLPHRYAAALTAGDADAAAELFAVDAVQIDPYGSAPRHGREAIRAFFEVPAAERSGRRFEIVELHGTSEAVAFSFRFTPGAGSENTLRGIDAFELDSDGLIRVHVAYFGPNDWSAA